MFLLDDILLAPIRGVHFIASSIYDAAQEEVENEKRMLRDELNDLYMELETGDLSEEEFEAREEEILNRLDELEQLEQELEGGEDQQ
jgi:hypothetical protein